MRTIETDYLVVGAGATAMAFVDDLLAAADVEVVMVDRRARPGGHWNDAYPFVRLHQPSANYGVNSRQLGRDLIDESGPNKGFYERASKGEILDYFGRVLDEQFVPSGRVQFLAKHDYRGADGDGHRVVSLLTGEETVIKVRRKLVDATYVESTIPSRHTPSFSVDPDVRFIPPNGLVDLHEPGAGFTVLGAGKTAMDTCVWLLEAGVDPGAIQWVRPRDGWFFDREAVQPLDLVANVMEFQASWVESAALAEDGLDWCRRMEAANGFSRIDPTVEPEMFRGAVVSAYELEKLRSIERVVRQRRVKHITTTTLGTDQGDLPAPQNQVYVDCTACGINMKPVKPIFEPGRITLQYVGAPPVPYAAAQIGFVESRDASDEEKNALCPGLTLGDNLADILVMVNGTLVANVARVGDADLGAWTERSRLNMTRGGMERMDDPIIGPAVMKIGMNFGPAMENLGRLLQG